MTAPGILQVCSRCQSRWPVALGANGPVPARWCPRCRGSLLAPTSMTPTSMAPAASAPLPAAAPSAPAPRVVVRPPAGSPAGSGVRLVKGYRWVARMPEPPAGDDAVSAVPRPLGPTPRYRTMPRWGLPVGPAPEPEGSGAAVRNRRSWAVSGRASMWMLVWVLTLAVLAEAFRYALLIWNQSHLVHRVTVAVSDAASLVLGVLAPVMVVLAAIGCAGWLAHTRAEHYARAGWRDPRSERSIFLGTLVPGWNLVMPGVFLTELAMLGHTPDAAADGPGLPPTGAFASAPAGKRRLSRLRALATPFQRTFAELPALWLVRLWWGMWVLANITVVGVLLTRFDTSMQGRADGVLYSLYANLLALAVAGLTITVMARFDARPRTREAAPPRWLIAT